MKKTLFLLSLIFLCTCASQKETEVPSPSNPVVTTPSPAPEVPLEINYRSDWDREKLSAASVWEGFVVKALESHGDALLNRKVKDANKYCPKYNSLNKEDRKKFYVMLISSMAKNESSNKTETVYVECSNSQSTYGSSGKYFPDLKKWCIPGHEKDGGIAKSRGLTQISMQSAQSYGCKVSKPEDLNNPQVNLECAVKILERWVGRDSYIGSSNVSGIKNAGGGRYWSVLRDSSKSQIEIKSKTSSFCTEMFQ